MRTLVFAFFAFLFSHTLSAQTRINGAFAFQNDPAKKYALYIPAAYNPAVPHKMVLGLHALNTARWNANSWCDTLVDFAAANNILLVCPDGGPDGAIDDPIDTAFTSVLLDSVAHWYNIDTNQRYIMGFSWGGLTTYSYGLNHADRFCGFLPIGAANNGAGVFNGIAKYATGKPFYLVHGSLDAVNISYYPALNTLNAWNANVNSLLMPGVGHTVDFPNRNQILTTAFQWLESENSCAPISATGEARPGLALHLANNPLKAGDFLTVQLSVPAACNLNYQLFQNDGKILLQENRQLQAGANNISIQMPQGTTGLLQLLGQCIYGTGAVPVLVH